MLKLKNVVPAVLVLAGLAMSAYALSVSGVYIKSWNVQPGADAIVFVVCGQVCITQEDIADGVDGAGIAKCNYVDEDPVFDDTLFTSTTWEHDVDLSDLVGELEADPNKQVACKEVCVHDVRVWSLFQTHSGEGTVSDPIEVIVTLDVYVPPNSASGSSGTTNVWN